MNVEELFQSFSGKKIHVLLNEGNRGDGLIHEGGRTLFRKYNINYEEFVFPAEKSGDILCVYGCGGFCSKHQHNIRKVNHYTAAFKTIYILPSTFECSCKNVADFILRLPRKVVIYCREKESFEEVKKVAPYKENVFLDKDMAFHLDYSKWKTDGRGVLMAFRYDEEKNMSFFVRGYIKCLKEWLLFAHNAVYMDVSAGPSNEWKFLLETVSQFNEVHTDRAHTSIAAAMLGKKTHIYPGAYFKQKAIYEHSLSHMPNVKLMWP